MKRIIIIMLLLLAAFIAFEFITLPDVSVLREEHPSTTAFMELRKRELAREGKDPTISYKWVAYDRISPYLRRAVLVSEDNAFYEHKGVDVDGLKEAVARDLKKKKFAFGGSTITQQLAKNLYLSPSKNPLRKLKEFIIAKRLENELSKKRILEIYLNVVEMGERVYGAEAASRYYFHKSASALTPSEAALLAGCLPNPRIMVPGEPNRRLRARQRIILSRLRRWGYVFEREVLTEKKETPKEEVPAPEPTSTATEAESDTAAVESDVTTTEQITETVAEPRSDTAAPDTAQQPEETATDTAPPPQ